MRHGRWFLKGFVVLLCLAVVASVWRPSLDTAASHSVNQALKRAAAVYASARLIHASVSVLQGTQVNVEPAGIGATFTPGQVLAPASELLKQFSDLMLMICVTLGIEKILIVIGAHHAVAYALIVVTLGWLWAARGERRPPAWLSKVFLLLLMVRFALPLTLVGSGEIFDRFLADDYRRTGDALGKMAKQSEQSGEPVVVDAKDLSMFDRLKIWLDRKTSGAKTNYDAIKAIVANMAEHVVELLSIFVLQSLVLPPMLLWVLYAVTRALLRWPGEDAVRLDRSPKSAQSLRADIQDSAIARVE